jgi:hypothetical protein
MALSNLSKQTLHDLFEMIHVENDKQSQIIQHIKNDYILYSKLSLISKQINALKSEAIDILEIHKTNSEVFNAKCAFKKVPGNYYYLYENGERYLSLIPPEKWWGDPGTFISKLYFDYDHCFYFVK